MYYIARKEHVIMTISFDLAAVENDQFSKKKPFTRRTHAIKRAKCFRRRHLVYAKAKDSLDGGGKEVGSATRIGRSETVRSCDGPRVDRSRSKTPLGPRGIYLRPRSHHPPL